MKVNKRQSGLRDVVATVLLCGLVLLVGCANGRRAGGGYKKIEYPDGYLSSYYDAFQQMYLQSDNHTPKGFDELVRRYPDSAEAHLMRADAYMQFGNYVEARQSVDRSLALDSTNAAAYSKRIDIRIAQREPLDSLFDDELRCVHLDSTNSVYLHRLLFHLHDAGHYEECIAYSLQNYGTQNEGGILDVILSSCYLRRGDRELMQEHLSRFAAREDTSPGLNGFALMPAAMLGDGSLIELFYARAKQGGCVSALYLSLYQSYLKHNDRIEEAFNEGARMVAQCDYDTNDVERMLQSLSPVGILDSAAMAAGLRYTDLMLQRYSRSSVVLSFAETMYRKVKDNARTYALLRRTAELDSGDFLRWALLQEFEDRHKQIGGKWELRTQEDWQDASRTYPLSSWDTLTATHRYVLRKFPNSLSVMQYLARLYAVTQSYDMTRDTARVYIEYYKRCLKQSKKRDTLYYHGAVWEQRLSSRTAYGRVISSLYGFIGDQYMNREMREAAYKEYEQGLKYNPDNAMLLNNYAYFLAKDSTLNRLKKAERMSRRSITLEPRNATYLDTYAYILYLKGDYVGAKSYYTKLFSLGEVESAEVYRNYSDLLDAMGNTTTAEVYRMRAEGLEKKQQ